MESDTTTIQVTKITKERISGHVVKKNESFDDILKRILDVYEERTRTK